MKDEIMMKLLNLLVLIFCVGAINTVPAQNKQKLEIQRKRPCQEDLFCHVHR